MKIKVERWTSYNYCNKNAKNIKNIGCSGCDKSWQTYLDSISEEDIKYYIALRNNIVQNNIRITGQDHQYSDNGVPVFNDGVIATFSFRSWGRLMSAIWSTEDEKQYNYMDFYC